MPDSTDRPGTTVGAFEDDDLLPLSGLQHQAFCGRQCALFHVEGLWLENQRTVEGRHLHERVLACEPEHVQPYGNLGLAYVS